MPFLPNLLSVVLSLSVLLSTLVAAQDASYTFTTFDLPSPGAQVNGINTAGQIVGYFGPGDATGRDYGYVIDGATVTIIEFPGANHTHVYGINDRGHIVGSFYDGAMWHGFLKEGATFTTFDVPGASSTEALAINTAGQIVGTFRDGTTSDGFLKEGATFTTFDFPGATFTWPTGINETGQIVGSFDDGTGTTWDGFLKDGATFTTFDVLGGTNTWFRGINTAGQIVGYVFDAPMNNRSFLKEGATITIIAVPGARDTVARGINETGHIVGLFEDATGWHGFVATPIMDTTAPVITISASPATLSPPNGRLVTVTVSGTITDEPAGSGVQANSAAYQVMDEYGQIQLSGSVIPRADGSYAFTVALEASRRGNDQDGRQYMIAVSAKDNAGNLGGGSTLVTVPHDQGK